MTKVCLCQVSRWMFPHGMVREATSRHFPKHSPEKKKVLTISVFHSSVHPSISLPPPVLHFPISPTPYLCFSVSLSLFGHQGSDSQTTKTGVRDGDGDVCAGTSRRSCFVRCRGGSQMIKPVARLGHIFPCQISLHCRKT